MKRFYLFRKNVKSLYPNRGHFYIEFGNVKCRIFHCFLISVDIICPSVPQMPADESVKFESQSGKFKLYWTLSPKIYLRLIWLFCSFFCDSEEKCVSDYELCIMFVSLFNKTYSSIKNT